MRKNLIAGAAILALLMNSPQVNADEIVVFGGEFEEETPAQKPVEKPAPIKELPPEPPQVEEPAPVEQPAPVEEKPEVIEQKPPTKPLEQSEQPAPVEEKPEVIEQKPPTRPLEQSETPAVEQPAPVERQKVSTAPPEDEDDIGDTLIFDDLTRTPEQQPVEQPQPSAIDEPTTEIDRPFGQPSVTVPPTPEFKPPQSTAPATSVREQPSQPARRSLTPRTTQPQKNLKILQPRFVKLAVDDTYIYYLDKNSVQWKKMPYSTSEYIADVWVRMIERTPRELDDDMATYGADNFNAEISLAREQGYQYAAEDLQVLRSQAYVLEHYYLRPKTKQIQFLCELEVFGRPQNTVSERAYDYRNWENLVPGSVESVIYESTIKIIGTWKSTERGHMTFSDMLDEYLRIAL